MTVTKKYLIGIDVGGTNTDSVLLDPRRVNEPNHGIFSWHKSVTTPDVSDGIQAAILKLFEEHREKMKEVMAVTIGTTHFINAVIEQDRARLNKVAVIRLCSLFSRYSPPFCDFPEGLAEVVNGYIGYCTGGNQVDGQEINELDELEIRAHCVQIKEKGIKAVAVVGIFSMMDSKQELRAAQIIKEEIPDADIVVSHEISGIGFLERESATVLNASIKAFARKIITSFNLAVQKLGLDCAVLLTQNDGTVLTTEEAMKTPIRTFSSGATNSMRGAGFLCATHPQVQGHNVLVVDVGGTTTDVGMLLSTGFPRQSSTYSIIGGVRMNFSMPHVQSIGLGGGSIVRGEGLDLTIGPDSVGADIVNKSLVFGGDVVTTTDVTIAKNIESSDYDKLVYEIGDITKVRGKFSEEYQVEFAKVLKRNIEKILDRMRTSPEPIAVILVGGGSFIVPTELEGASVVLRPPYFQIANAIGSALPKISHTILKMKSIENASERDKFSANLLDEAKAALISKGVMESSIDIATLFNEPIPYADKIYKFEVKVVGEVDYDNVIESLSWKQGDSVNLEVVNEIHKNSLIKESKKFETATEVDHLTYKPTVNENREWILSETDLEYIVIGAYILGCGGGGDPHGSHVVLREQLRRGEIVRIVTIEDVHKYCEGEGTILNVGYCGSPSISGEKLHGPELAESVELMSRWLNKKPDAVFPFEIGGDNGLQGMIAGSSGSLNIPVVDADLMGRLMALIFQTLPSVFSPTLNAFKTTTCSDGNGNHMILSSTKNDFFTETIQRDAFNYHGVQFAFCDPPMTAKQMVQQTVPNVHSLSWRIGRAVKIARAASQIDSLPETLINSVGGPTTARCMFKAKIVKIDKKIDRGYSYGECYFESTTGDGLYYKILFKNENVVCYEADNIDMENSRVICSVPDLFTAIDADTGEAIGTQDYRYGIQCFLLAISPSTQWTESERGMEFGGPKSFGELFADIEYKPIGKYIKPVSIIDEFGPKTL